MLARSLPNLLRVWRRQGGFVQPQYGLITPEFSVKVTSRSPTVAFRLLEGALANGFKEVLSDPGATDDTAITWHHKPAESLPTTSGVVMATSHKITVEVQPKLEN